MLKCFFAFLRKNKIFSKICQKLAGKIVYINESRFSQKGGYRQMKVSIKTIEELKRGYESAFNEVYEAYEKLLYFLIFSIVRNKEVAKDVLQDVFVKVFVDTSSLRSPKNFHSWIIKIAKNSALTIAKKSSKYISLEDCDIDKISLEAYKAQYNFDISKLFSAEDNLIVIYHLVYGISFKEIATMLNTTFDRVVAKYYRVIRKIRALHKEAKMNEKKKEK